MNDTAATLTATATRPIFCRTAWDTQITLPAGRTVTVTEGRRGFVIRPVDRPGVRSIDTYTWGQLVARVEVP